jgi:uridine kinase
MAARVVLLAGASGSGKTSLCRRVGLPVLALDHFYRDGDDPQLPHRFGIVDWDHPDCWDPDAAMATVARLCAEGAADVPTYDIPTSRRIGRSRLDLAGAPVLVAEGIFAASLVTACRDAGLLADALCLQMHPAQTFVRRLARDLVESRKPPLTLVKRGLGLARGERAQVQRWVAAGCRPLTLPGAERALRTLAIR